MIRVIQKMELSSILSEIIKKVTEVSKDLMHLKFRNIFIYMYIKQRKKFTAKLWTSSVRSNSKDQTQKENRRKKQQQIYKSIIKTLSDSQC